MISIIVSSVNPEQNRAFRRNIEETIGVDHELLIHDNRQSGWGLCKLYNLYAAKSQYDILCFFHEDILFHTQDWGQKLVEFFGSQPKAGVVGFAGATIKTEHITGWGSHSRASRIHLFQRSSNGKMLKLNDNIDCEDFSPVALVDGLALIVPKKIWHEHPFDEELFRRFHLYDLDFTMQVAQHYTNYVCHTIDVEHLSSGSYTQEWFDESKKFIHKWSDHLPFCAYSSSEQFIRKCQRFDAYQASRLQLKMGLESSSLSTIFGQFRRVDTFPYKFRLIRHVFKATAKHIRRRLSCTTKK